MESQSDHKAGPFFAVFFAAEWRLDSSLKILCSPFIGNFTTSSWDQDEVKQNYGKEQCHLWVCANSDVRRGWFSSWVSLPVLLLRHPVGHINAAEQAGCRVVCREVHTWIPSSATMTKIHLHLKSRGPFYRDEQRHSPVELFICCNIFWTRQFTRCMDPKTSAMLESVKHGWFG